MENSWTFLWISLWKFLMDVSMKYCPRTSCSAFWKLWGPWRNVQWEGETERENAETSSTPFCSNVNNSHLWNEASSRQNANAVGILMSKKKAKVGHKRGGTTNPPLEQECNEMKQGRKNIFLQQQQQKKTFVMYNNAYSSPGRWFHFCRDFFFRVHFFFVRTHSGWLA